MEKTKLQLNTLNFDKLKGNFPQKTNKLSAKIILNPNATRINTTRLPNPHNSPLLKIISPVSARNKNILINDYSNTYATSSYMSKDSKKNKPNSKQYPTSRNIQFNQTGQQSSTYSNNHSSNSNKNFKTIAMNKKNPNSSPSYLLYNKLSSTRNKKVISSNFFHTWYNNTMRGSKAPNSNFSSIVNYNNTTLTKFILPKGKKTNWTKNKLCLTNNSVLRSSLMNNTYIFKGNNNSIEGKDSISNSWLNGSINSNKKCSIKMVNNKKIFIEKKIESLKEQKMIENIQKCKFKIKITKALTFHIWRTYNQQVKYQEKLTELDLKSKHSLAFNLVFIERYNEWRNIDDTINVDNVIINHECKGSNIDKCLDSINGKIATTIDYIKRIAHVSGSEKNNPNNNICNNISTKSRNEGISPWRPIYTYNNNANKKKDTQWNLELDKHKSIQKTKKNQTNILNHSNQALKEEIILRSVTDYIYNNLFKNIIRAISGVTFHIIYKKDINSKLDKVPSNKNIVSTVECIKRNISGNTHTNINHDIVAQFDSLLSLFVSNEKFIAKTSIENKMFIKFKKQIVNTFVDYKTESIINLQDEINNKIHRLSLWMLSKTPVFIQQMRLEVEQLCIKANTISNYKSQNLNKIKQEYQRRYVIEYKKAEAEFNNSGKNYAKIITGWKERKADVKEFYDFYLRFLILKDLDLITFNNAIDNIKDHLNTCKNSTTVPREVQAVDNILSFYLEMTSKSQYSINDYLYDRLVSEFIATVQWPEKEIEGDRFVISWKLCVLYNRVNEIYDKYNTTFMSKTYPWFKKSEKKYLEIISRYICVLDADNHISRGKTNTVLSINLPNETHIAKWKNIKYQTNCATSTTSNPMVSNKEIVTQSIQSIQNDRFRYVKQGNRLNQITALSYPKLFLLPDKEIEYLSTTQPQAITQTEIISYYYKINKNKELLLSSQSITGIKSSITWTNYEIFTFKTPIAIPGYNTASTLPLHFLSELYSWIDKEISNTLSECTVISWSEFSKKSFQSWVNSTLIQVSINTLSLIFTNEISLLLLDEDEKLKLEKKTSNNQKKLLQSNSLKKDFEKIIQKYNSWIKDKEKLNTYLQTNIILTIINHITILEALIRSNITDINSFDWLKYIRHWWDQNKREVIIECGGWTNYQMKNYLSLSHQRILMTPDTDRIFLFNSSSFREKSASIIKITNNKYHNQSYKEVFQEFCYLFWVDNLIFDINTNICITTQLNEIKELFDIATGHKIWIYFNGIDTLNKEMNTKINYWIYISKFMQIIQQEVILNDIKSTESNKMFCWSGCISIDNSIKSKECYLKSSSRILNFVKPDMQYYIKNWYLFYLQYKNLETTSTNNNWSTVKKCVAMLTSYESDAREKLETFYYDFDFYHGWWYYLINTSKSRSASSVSFEKLWKMFCCSEYSRKLLCGGIKGEDNSSGCINGDNGEKIAVSNNDIIQYFDKNNILYSKEHIEMFKYWYSYCNASSQSTSEVVDIPLVLGFGSTYLIKEFIGFLSTMNTKINGNIKVLTTTNEEIFSTNTTKAVSGNDIIILIKQTPNKGKHWNDSLSCSGSRMGTVQIVTEWYNTPVKTIWIPPPIKRKKLLKLFFLKLNKRLIKSKITISDEYQTTLWDYIHNILKAHSTKYYLDSLKFYKWANYIIIYLWKRNKDLNSVSITYLFIQSILYVFPACDAWWGIIIKYTHQFISSNIAQNIIEAFTKEGFLLLMDFEQLVFRSYSMSELEGYYEKIVKDCIVLSEDNKELVFYIHENFVNHYPHSTVFEHIDMNHCNYVVYQHKEFINEDRILSVIIGKGYTESWTCSKEWSRDIKVTWDKLVKECQWKWEKKFNFDKFEYFLTVNPGKAACYNNDQLSFIFSLLYLGNGNIKTMSTYRTDNLFDIEDILSVVKVTFPASFVYMETKNKFIINQVNKIFKTKILTTPEERCSIPSSNVIYLNVDAAMEQEYITQIIWSLDQNVSMIKYIQNNSKDSLSTSAILNQRKSSDNLTIIEIDTLCNMITSLYSINNEYQFNEEFSAANPSDIVVKIFQNILVSSKDKKIFTEWKATYPIQTSLFSYLKLLVNYIKHDKITQSFLNKHFIPWSTTFWTKPQKSEIIILVNNSISKYVYLISKPEWINSKFFYFNYLTTWSAVTSSSSGTKKKQSPSHKSYINAWLEKIFLSISNHFLYSLILALEIMFNNFEISNQEMSFIIHYWKENYFFPDDNSIKYKFDSNSDNYLDLIVSNGNKLLSFYKDKDKATSNEFINLLEKSVTQSTSKYFFTSNSTKISKSVDKLLYYITFIPEQSPSIFKYIINKYLRPMYDIDKYSVNNFLTTSTAIPITIKAAGNINITNFLCSLSAYYEIQFYIIRSWNFMDNGNKGKTSQPRSSNKYQYIIDSNIKENIEKAMIKGNWIFISEEIDLDNAWQVWEIVYDKDSRQPQGKGNSKKIHKNFKLFFDSKWIGKDCQKVFEDKSILLQIDNENIDDLEAAHDIWVNVLEERLLTESLMDNTQNDFLDVHETEDHKNNVSDITIHLDRAHHHQGMSNEINLSGISTLNILSEFK